jgi:hypothetical protein
MPSPSLRHASGHLQLSPTYSLINRHPTFIAWIIVRFENYLFILYTFYLLIVSPILCFRSCLEQTVKRSHFGLSFDRSLVNRSKSEKWRSIGLIFLLFPTRLPRLDTGVQ